jgi:hypothetical protein
MFAPVSPSLPHAIFKRQFRLEFTNYLRSNLTLGEVSSLYVSLGDNPRRIIQLMAALSSLSQR